MKPLSGKNPSASQTIKTEVVCHNDTNPMGILQGGRLLQWMDIAAAVSAQTHAEQICVTASINEMNFKYPARIGEVVIIESKITRAFSTSMEIFVQAFSKNIKTQKRNLISDGYFTFVALNEKAVATNVPELHPYTKEERIQFDNALQRRNFLLHGNSRLKTLKQAYKNL